MPFSCPYCDALGESFIEASDKTIVRISKAILPSGILAEFFEEEEK